MLAHQESPLVLTSLQRLVFNMIPQAKVAIAFSFARFVERTVPSLFPFQFVLPSRPHPDPRAVRFRRSQTVLTVDIHFDDARLPSRATAGVSCAQSYICGSQRI
jgi:hypothetical protein